MPETQDAARRRWSGFVCPDCRYVFRVPRDHDGQGVLCPNCRRVLRIPGPGDSPPPLVVPLPEPAPDASSSKGVKRRRRRKSRSAADHAWEHTPGHGHDASDGGKQQMSGMLVLGSLLLVLAIGGLLFAMLRGRQPVSVTVPLPAVASPPQADAAAAVRSEMDDAAFLKAAEPLAGKFLTATRVEDVLPLVREPQRAEPRLRAMFPDGHIEAPGLDAFNTQAAVVRNGGILSVQVRTRAFEEKALSFVSTPQGLKIDWEAWAAWSEMPWDEFLTAKPVEPVLFRVVLSPVDYYNFAFSDDRKWRSYRLVSPDGEHALYAYVERGTLLDSRMLPSPDVKQLPMTLRLAFPPGADARNQVLVRELLAEGWALENEPSP